MKAEVGFVSRKDRIAAGKAIRVPACGDCHLLNFGILATAERNLVFDVNDLDESCSSRRPGRRCSLDNVDSQKWEAEA